MSTIVSDCDTVHLITYEIKTKKHLKKLNGKFYMEHENDPDFKMLKANKDEHLIGKKILVRSAVTCSLGDCVCPKCVGYTAITNFDIADGLGAFESEEISKVVEQNVLSTKHLLTTNSEEIKFNKEFYDFFVLIGGEINPNVNDNEKVPDIEDWAIKILPDEMNKVEEMDDDSLYNSFIASSRFFVVNTITEEEIEIKLENDKEIFISEDIMNMIKKDKKGLVYFKNLDDDVKLFEVNIENNELTKPLHELMALLNNASSKDLDITLSDMCQRMLDILIEANIKANVISAELIINRLVRSLVDPYKRPDFSREELEPYTIRTVNNALENNKSPLVGLSFQNIKRQIMSDELYTERNGSSYIDSFYKENVSTKNYKNYHDIIKKIRKKK